MSNSKNQPNNRISEDVNLSSMTKELRADVDKIIRDVNITAGSRVDELVALFESYATERERKSYLKGYNTGWQSGKRFNPNKISYFAEQLEYTAKKLREVESALKETAK